MLGSISTFIKKIYWRTTKKYRSTSWIDPCCVVRSSPINGKGLFARAPIKECEVVIIWGGKLFSQRDIQEGKARKHSDASINESLVIAGLPEDPRAPDDFMNHSCDPNLWMKDEVTVEARRDIMSGEELTLDCALWNGDEDWVMTRECQCGSELCRRIISGKDWRLDELQERYTSHFSPFINKRIRKVKLQASSRDRS